MESTELFRLATLARPHRRVESEAREHCRRKSMRGASHLGQFMRFFIEWIKTVFLLARITEKCILPKAFKFAGKQVLRNFATTFHRVLKTNRKVFLCSCLPFCTPSPDKDVLLSLKRTHKATGWCEAAVLLSFQSAAKICHNSKKNLECFRNCNGTAVNFLKNIFTATTDGDACYSQLKSSLNYICDSAKSLNWKKCRRTMKLVWPAAKCLSGILMERTFTSTTLLETWIPKWRHSEFSITMCTEKKTFPGFPRPDYEFFRQNISWNRCLAVSRIFYRVLCSKKIIDGKNWAIIHMVGYFTYKICVKLNKILIFFNKFVQICFTTQILVNNVFPGAPTICILPTKHTLANNVCFF